MHEQSIAHNTLSPDKIYLNPTTLNVYVGPYKFGSDDNSNFWYSSPETSSINSGIRVIDDFKSDVWSMGCIIAQIFLVSSPIFQCFSYNDKLSKVVEVLGLPHYEDVIDYINMKEYKSLKEFIRYDLL